MKHSRIDGWTVVMILIYLSDFLRGRSKIFLHVHSKIFLHVIQILSLLDSEPAITMSKKTAPYFPKLLSLLVDIKQFFLDFFFFE
jgi:hypothetical protein